MRCAAVRDTKPEAVRAQRRLEDRGRLASMKRFSHGWAVYDHGPDPEMTLCLTCGGRGREDAGEACGSIPIPFGPRCTGRMKAQAGRRTHG